MAYQHTELAAGKWHQLSLAEQLGHVGSEISRASKWENKAVQPFEGAVFRALELLDLTLDDPRWKAAHRLREIARVREIVCDAYLGGEAYGSRFEDLIRYFDAFAFEARSER